MISVSEAKAIIRSSCSPAAPVPMALPQAAGLVLGADLLATTSIPAFDQSSMDGYAFNWQQYQEGNALNVQGEAAAGIITRVQLKPQQAIRIFTGAALPEGADTVVMQEKVTVEDGRLIVQDAAMSRGQHVRPKGSEIQAGALALSKGSLLTPPAIGFLAGIGITTVMVLPPPRVSILITGNELQQPGFPLNYGQVYESNSFALTVAIQRLSITDISIFHVPDDPEQLTQSLEGALPNSELVLLTGGVSVGDHDHVVKATERCGVSRLFHRVSQRPGKPLYFGMKGTQMVFGLPGNPSSVLTCFYEYVLTALEQYMGRRGILPVRRVKLGNAYPKTVPLTQFLKGHLDNETVIALDAQESYRLSSFARANCLIYLDEGIRDYQPGDLVEIHILS